MKIALYLEQGKTVIVLTPEHDWEKQLIFSPKNNQLRTEVSIDNIIEDERGILKKGGDEKSIVFKILDNSTIR